MGNTDFQSRATHFQRLYQALQKFEDNISHYKKRFSPKTENSLNMKKNYPFFMKISGAHLQKNPCTYFLQHEWTKSCQ